MSIDDRIHWGRAAMAALAGYVVTVGLLTLLFGNPIVVDLLFTEAAGQSSKAVAVWRELEPLPAATPFWDDPLDLSGRGIVVQGLLLLWAFGVVVIYAKLRDGLAGGELRRGLTFGAGVWWVLFVFFESWVPFNLFGEPLKLALLELGLELLTMLAAGVTIAMIYRAPTRKA